MLICTSYTQDATDVYKRLLMENREYAALNVYVGLCYSKLDFYDVSLEILGSYLSTYPGSGLAFNLKACNLFRLYNGKAAEGELKVRLGRFSSIASWVNDATLVADWPQPHVISCVRQWLF